MTPVTLITGAGGGIGLAVARLAASTGAALALVDRDLAGLERATAEISQYGAPFTCIEGDVANWDDVGSWPYQVEQELGSQMSTLIHCAGVFTPKVALGDGSHELLLENWEVNAASAYRCTQAFASMLQAGSPSSVVLVSSIAAEVGSRSGAAHYAMSKGAINSLTKSLAWELAPSGIRVNAVAPGAVSTPMLEKLGKDTHHAATNSLGRPGKPNEIAEVIAFLASDRSSFVNGQIWRVCGGAA